MGAPRASVKYQGVHRENLTVPARAQHSGMRDHVDAIGSSTATDMVCTARRNPCIIQMQVLVDCLSFFDRVASCLNGYIMPSIASTSSNITHTFFRRNLSTSLPLAFQSSPSETTTNHLPWAIDVLPSKHSAMAGTVGFLWNTLHLLLPCVFVPTSLW